MLQPHPAKGLSGTQTPRWDPLSRRATAGLLTWAQKVSLGGAPRQHSLWTPHLNRGGLETAARPHCGWGCPGGWRPSPLPPSRLPPYVPEKWKGWDPPSGLSHTWTAAASSPAAQGFSVVTGGRVTSSPSPHTHASQPGPGRAPSRQDNSSHRPILKQLFLTSQPPGRPCLMNASPRGLEQPSSRLPFWITCLASAFPLLRRLRAGVDYLSPTGNCLRPSLSFLQDAFCHFFRVWEHPIQTSICQG